jgi:hypothetical protein
MMNSRLPTKLPLAAGLPCLMTVVITCKEGDALRAIRIRLFNIT